MLHSKRAPECDFFFSEVLGMPFSDVAKLPVKWTLATMDDNLWALADCKTMTVYVAPTIAYNPAMARIIAVHELAHMADCKRNAFPLGGPVEEGEVAVKACFGR